MINKTVICPGTFDPITNGHIDLIRRGSLLFAQVFIAITEESKKSLTFSITERKNMVEQIFKNYNNIKVYTFTGLLIDFAKSKNIKIILRGLRSIFDMQYNAQLAYFNKLMCNDIETVFLISDNKYVNISSSMVKEIADIGGDISRLVPNEIHSFIRDTIVHRKKLKL